MKLGRAFLISILFVIVSPAAFAQTVWTCTWAAGYGTGSKPVISRFRVVGGEVVDDKWQQHYRILQDNTYSLVAAWSISEIEPHNRRPSVGAFIIVIDKQTNEFKVVSVGIREPDYAPSTGTCIPK
jgi:hypothetical protein